MVLILAAVNPVAQAREALINRMIKIIFTP
jgi:hypothetical protein